MLFLGRFQCPQCLHAFAVHVTGKPPAEPNAALIIRCPMDGTPHRVPFSLFHPIDSCPLNVQPEPLERLFVLARPIQRKPKKWWQFWK